MLVLTQPRQIQAEHSYACRGGKVAAIRRGVGALTCSSDSSLILVFEDFYVFRLISVKTASGRDFGEIWARVGSPLGALLGTFWVSFGGHIRGVACKTVSKAISEHFQV